jgi:hypothetical protein
LCTEVSIDSIQKLFNVIHAAFLFLFDDRTKSIFYFKMSILSASARIYVEI